MITGVPQKKSSAVDQVVGQVNGWITQGVYQLGDKLPSESKLAELTGIGRSSVREAMRQLAANGLVVIKHGSGTYISASPIDLHIRSLQGDLDGSDWTPHMLTEFRETLEKAIVALAIQNADESQLANLQQINIRMREGVESGLSEDALLEFDLMFHHALARCTGNVLVSILYDNAMSFISTKIKHIYENKISSGYLSYLSHQRIIDALLHRDLDTANIAVIESLRTHNAVQKRSDSDGFL